MQYWIIPALMSLAVAMLIGLAVLRARQSAGTGDDAAQDLAVYRKQLDEVERDRERGTIPEDEAERLRAEIARRLIAADTRAADSARAQEPTRLRPALVVVVLGTLVALPLALYARIGAPGYGDLSLSDRMAAAQERRETRPAQAEAEAAVPAGAFPGAEAAPPDFEALIDKLRIAVLERPDDLQGQELLARNEAALGNFRAAYAAQGKVLGIKGDAATGADYLAYADLMILAAGGYVSPEAENALRAALVRDPENGAARYYLGLMMRQNDRPDVAFRLWDQLLRKGPEDAPWIPPIRAQIDEAAFLAGIEYEQPAPAETLAGPTAADVANAGDMTAEERTEMIRGMVARLSDRLATQGGSPAEWARLVGAYGVLGDVTRARAIADEGRQVFAGNAQALALIDDAVAGLPDAAQAAPTPAPAPAPAAPGPSAADVQAASEMSAEDRAEMIRSMVARLAERLETEGGTAEEWARLVNAYVVQQDIDAARAAVDKARAAHAGDDAALAVIAAAAARLPAVSPAPIAPTAPGPEQDLPAPQEATE